MDIDNWKAWHKRTTDTLQNIEYAVSASDHDYATSLIADHYCYNKPCVFTLPDWAAFGWDWQEIKQKVGDCHVEYQKGRTSNPRYEVESAMLRHTGPFKHFLNEILFGAENDVYMTAQNSDKNTNAMAPLFEDIAPLPTCLIGPASRGFLWIGGATVTPLHHDLTNNMMCQIIGRKNVRVVSPDQIDKLAYANGVHSHIGWLDDREALDRGINYIDFWIRPQTALFLPVGWWHCVRSDGPSVTVVYTSFKWHNSFDKDFT